VSTPSLGRHSYIGEPHDITAKVRVGNYTSIAPYGAMHSRTQHPCITQPLLAASTSGHIPGYPKAYSEDRIDIGSDVWIGRNAVILGGVTIGHGAIIGAYAVVAKDIPPYAVAVGNPAQVIRYRFDADTIAHLLDLAWWDWTDDVIAERAADLRHVPTLLTKYGYAVYERERGRKGNGS
jgi:acetyltransferase-like isoleucine patch superfamily enzyme